MCGIAGVVTSGRPIPDAVSVGGRLADALAHRGPDCEGVWIAPGADVVLAHRRLAIIDLTEDGRQPMVTPDGRYRIVFNGEVYNYRELRRELEGRGERFASASDTEVLLRLIACEGPPALARVRGMFALGIWDAGDRSLLLARDRFGIKPLYAAVQQDSVAFASEIQSLLHAGVVRRDIEPAGVLAYFAWGSVPPPLAWIAGVESLTPGTWVRWSAEGGRSERRFADLGATYAASPDGTVERVAEQAIRERVRATVEESVAAHMVADVPVGIFLSGGIDSSAILSAAVSSGKTNLHTYTVRFEGTGSEHEYARLVATTFGATHHELAVDASHVVADLPVILARLDQPSWDGVNSFYVSRAVAAAGIKAVLSGTGGDEMFGGYPSFRRVPMATSVKRCLGPVFPTVAAAVGGALPERLAPRWRCFAANPSTSANGSIESAYRAQRGVFMPAELAELCGPALKDCAIARNAAERLAAVETALFAAPHASSLAGEVARCETQLYMRAQLLRDLDVMSMTHSLEVRVPFVDHVLLEAVWPDLGAHPSLMRNKRLLHETLAQPLPPVAVNRPKQGFTLPFARWIGGELEPFVRSGMEHLVQAGWIAPGIPESTWQAWRRGAAHWSRLWALGVLGEFLRRD